MELMMASNDTAADPIVQTVQLAGKTTVAGAADLKMVLVEALDSADEVILDVSGITACDPSFFQLLCAAHQSSAVRRPLRLPSTPQSRQPPLFWFLPSASVALKASQRPSGEITAGPEFGPMQLKVVPSGGRIAERTVRVLCASRK